MAEYELRPYRPGDEEGILATFNLVFGQDNPDFVPRTMEDWRWAYLDNPAGIRVWVAMYGDLVAAHYASQPNRVRIGGEERIFGQIIDSMVHPEHRRGLKRPGLFVETARKMLAETCGPDKDLVTFGLPIAEAWRMGKTFLRYEMVRRQTFLSREMADESGELPEGVEELSEFPADVQELYERCASEWGASVLRDDLYLNWRFVRCPRHTYRIVAVRRDSKLSGYIVFRREDWPVPGAGLIVDWLVPSGDSAVGELLRDAALALARRDGADRVLAIFPEWSPWFERFQAWGWLVHPSDYLMSGRDNDPVHHMYWLRRNWWYQMAELDLV